MLRVKVEKQAQIVYNIQQVQAAGVGADMVISGGSAEAPWGTGVGWGSGSDGSRVTHTLAPGESLTATESLGELAEGTWRFSITFGDEGRHSAEAERTLL